MPLMLDITYLEQVVDSDQIFSKALKGKAIQDKMFLGYDQFSFMKLLSLCYALKNKALV